MMVSEVLRIGTEWRAGEQTFASINPFTQAPWAAVPEATKSDVDDTIAATREAFDHGPWTRLSADQRAAVLCRIADLIERDADELALAESQDNGKGIREVSGQIRPLPAWYRYFGQLATGHEGRVVNTGKPNFFGYVETRTHPST